MQNLRTEAQSAFDLAQKDHQATKDNIALKKEALQTIRENVGALSAIGALDLERAAKAKAEGRDLTREQAEALKSTFGQGQELSKILTERSREGGREKVFETFAAESIEALQEKVETANQQKNQIIVLVEKRLEAEESSKQRLDAMETTLDKLNN